MTSKSRIRYPLSGADFSIYTREELAGEFLRILNGGIHGISFSVYMNDQAPGSQISGEQIAARMAVIKPYVQWIRSFSCTDGNEMIPRYARQNGLKTLVGAWLGSDEDKNEREVEGLIDELRTERDATLAMPKLIIPSLQVNMRAGEVPTDKDGRPMLKVPVNGL